MEDRESRFLNIILGVGYLLIMMFSLFFMKKDGVLSLFVIFLLLAIMLEIRNVQERDKAKKKTFNGNKTFNPYRPLTFMSVIFAVLLAIVKILEKAEVIDLS